MVMIMRMPMMMVKMVRIPVIIMIVIASVRTTSREVECKIFYTEQILKHHCLTPLGKIPNCYNLRFFTFLKLSDGSV